MIPLLLHNKWRVSINTIRLTDAFKTYVGRSNEKVNSN